MIYGIILGLHIVICVGLILVVLLQSGKGGGLAGAFGGMSGAGQALFGGRGAATFLSKATTVLGIAFMSSSLILALMSGTQSGPRSVIREGTITEGAPPPSTSAPLEIPGAGELLPPAPGEGAGEAAPVGPGGTQPAPTGTEGSEPSPGSETPPGGN